MRSSQQTKNSSGRGRSCRSDGQMWQRWKFQRAMRRAKQQPYSEALLREHVELLTAQAVITNCELTMLRSRLLLLELSGGRRSGKESSEEFETEWKAPSSLH